MSPRVLIISADAITKAGIDMSPEDLEFGFNRGLIEAGDVVEVATEELRRGSADPIILELACLTKTDVGRVNEVLELTADPLRIHDPRESARKWLFLELQELYLLRDRIDDPLGVIEEIYAEFDYPSVMASFVRYMPADEGHAVGAAAIVARWGAYLRDEHAALQREMR